jgi:hypothetical protein
MRKAIFPALLIVGSFFAIVLAVGAYQDYKREALEKETARLIQSVHQRNYESCAETAKPISSIGIECDHYLHLKGLQ